MAGTRWSGTPDAQSAAPALSFLILVSVSLETMLSFRPRRAWLLSALLVSACRLESHPPPGVPAEEAAIRSAIAAWTYKAEPWAQVVRSDVRQERDLASAWVVTSPPSAEEGERLELLVLQRGVTGWTVVFNSAPGRGKP
jgi:hypothetical protein